jgi:uncharacterized protein (TIGR02217 family)
MTAIFPALPGLGWSVTKAARFATRIPRAVNGRELRALDQPCPVWTWTLTHALLRDPWDRRGPGGLGIGPSGVVYNELRTLAGFFLQQQGALQPFLFDDPTDDMVTGQSLGTGDSSTSVFQLVRAMAGFAEPITAPNLVTAIYFNGLLQPSGGYAVDGSTGLVTFTAPPPSGQAITADFTYYFRVRFADDTAEFENFMYQLWQSKQIKLQSVFL